MKIKDLITLIACAVGGLLPTATQAEEKDLYDFLWLDPDKKVFVLQNKLFKKKGSLYTSIGYLSGLSSDFQSTKGVKGSIGYYLSEQFALELNYSKYSNSDNDALTSIRTINKSVPFIRRPDSMYGIVGIWSPFYGKINTFNKIFYFDWSFGAGAGQIETSHNGDTVSDPDKSDQFKTETKLNFLVLSRFRFHITEKVHLDIEYNRSHYKAEGALITGKPRTENWYTNSDLLLNIGLSF